MIGQKSWSYGLEIHRPRRGWHRWCLPFVSLIALGLAGYLVFSRPAGMLASSSGASTRPSGSSLPMHQTRPPSADATVDPASFDLPVLMYHYIRISPDPKTDRLGFNLSVTPEHFRAQMTHLQTNGYKTVTPDDLLAALKAGKKLPPKTVLLTIDDGYEDFYLTAYPILKDLHLKATLFVVSGFVGSPDGRYVTWPQIKEMDQSGLITIGAHTVHHVDLTTSRNAQAEIVLSKQAIEHQLGHTITAFAYPSGRANDAVAHLVEAAGFKLAFTTQYGRTMSFSHRFFLPRVRISGSLPQIAFPGRLVPPPQKPAVPVVPAIAG